MKLSELVEKLQDELAHFGDKEVVYFCECFENICDCFETPSDGNYPIGGIGWYAHAEKGEHKLQIICAECEHEAQMDHIRGKYGF